MSEEARRRDRLVGLFVFGMLLFNPPLLIIFGRGDELFGLPLLYVYLFTVWAVLIGAMAWVARRRRGRRPVPERDGA